MLDASLAIVIVHLGNTQVITDSKIE